MTQNPEYGLCGCRVDPHRCLQTSFEIHAVGKREVRSFKGFRCRFNRLAPGLQVMAGERTICVKFEGHNAEGTRDALLAAVRKATSYADL